MPMDLLHLFILLFTWSKVKVQSLKLTLNVFGHLLVWRHSYQILMVGKLPCHVYIKNRLLLLVL